MHFFPLLILSLFAIALLGSIGAAAWQQWDLYQGLFEALAAPN